MAVFVSISGPSVTGKTSLVDSLSTYQEMSKVRFSPDFHTVVWNDLKENYYFSEYTDITKDECYLCTYLHKLADTYNQYIEENKDYDGLVVLDGCWIDMFIYAELNMWYNRVISAAQAEVFEKLLKYPTIVEKIYLTRAADDKYPVDKHRVRGRVTTFKMNRPLEVQMYKAALAYKESVSLTTAEISGDSLIILEDLKKSGYLS